MCVDVTISSLNFPTVFIRVEAVEAELEERDQQVASLKEDRDQQMASLREEKECQLRELRTSTELSVAAMQHEYTIQESKVRRKEYMYTN